MISPELLRRYPFFGAFSENQLREIAMIAEEVTAGAGEVLFEECQPAEWLYLLLEGSVDLIYKSAEQYYPKTHKEFTVGEINPGEIFSLSSMIAPYVLNASGKTAKACRMVKIDAPALRQLCEKDCELGYHVLQGITKVLMERLTYTRVQLAAAWA